jgi:DNA-binding CsgD family transcriptional regulator
MNEEHRTRQAFNALKRPDVQAAIKRRAIALKMRNDGKTYREIALHLGISTKRAFTLVKRAIYRNERAA